MIKRRFYRIDHGERDGAADDSSSSSSSDGSDVEAQVSDHDDVDNGVNDDVSDDEDVSSPLKPSISSSGYESEDSSGNEIDADTSGLITKDDESGPESEDDELDGPTPRKRNGVTAKLRPEDLPVTDNIPNCVLKSKSVFKCRLCPKIVCLNEESLTTHLKSKRHARSEKLLNDGRLKRFLNSDGEEEIVTDDEDGETHAERHARIVAMAQPQDVPQDVSTKKSRGRQRQRQRLKSKKQKKASEVASSGKQRENRAKRRRKNVD